jgi:hypothetical protein
MLVAQLLVLLAIDDVAAGGLEMVCADQRLLDDILDAFDIGQAVGPVAMRQHLDHLSSQ